MKYKYLPWLILILLFSNCKQNKNLSVLSNPKKGTIDSLQKFSYLLTGVRNINNTISYTPIGSCFFLRTHDTLYIVTAKEIFSGKSVFDNKPLPDQYDTIAVRYFTKSDNKMQFINIPIDTLKKNIQNDLFFKQPNVYVYKIGKIPAGSKINSIEKFISDFKMFDETPDSVIIYSFEGKDKDKPFDFEKAQPKIFEGKIADIFHINPYFPAWDSLNITVSPETIHGMPGAPVFYKYSKLDTTGMREWITFGGLLFANDSAYKSGFTVRPVSVIKEISKIIPAK